MSAQDWAHLDSAEHGSKKERARLKGKNLWGDELHTALGLSDQTGAPFSVLCPSVAAAAGFHSTRSEAVGPAVSQLEGLRDALRFVDGCELGKPTVHIADREWDSGGHYRQWQHENRFLIVGAKTHRIGKPAGREPSLRRVVEAVPKQPVFRYRREVEVRGRVAKQDVAETTVLIPRPANPPRTRHGPTLPRIPGETITVRLVVSRREEGEGTLLSEWRLWTNVPAGELPAGVPDEQIAQWDYWRWKIDSFVKLLKGAGPSVEQGQQATVEASAKRLLVAPLAGVVVWPLARSQEPEADAFPQLLVRLSGRQMKGGTAFTAPALLAGLGILLGLLNVREQYASEEIKRLAGIFFLGPYPPESVKPLV